MPQIWLSYLFFGAVEMVQHQECLLFFQGIWVQVPTLMWSSSQSPAVPALANPTPSGLRGTHPHIADAHTYTHTCTHSNKNKPANRQTVLSRFRRPESQYQGAGKLSFPMKGPREKVPLPLPVLVAWGSLWPMIASPRYLTMFLQNFLFRFLQGHLALD